MAKRAALFLSFLFAVCLLKAQTVPDSTRAVDTSIVQPKPADSIPRVILPKPVKKAVDTLVVYHTDSLRYSALKPIDFSNLPVEWTELLNAQSQFNFLGKAVHVRSEKYEPQSYDLMFYILLGLLFYFALVKLFFRKYLGNLLTLFFRASMRQQQLREQVLQAPFPSLLLNILFIINGGLYGAFLLRYFHYGNPEKFWIHFLFCGGLLALLYLVKFMILKLVGWIFNINRAVETYLFVVFMTNKIIGIFLLPFIVLISFAGQFLLDFGVTVSIVLICIFYIYRFVASFSVLYKEIKISGLQFFLYICAFEIAPLLLIYKVLVSYLEKAY